MTRPLANVLLDDLSRRSNRASKARDGIVVEQMLGRLFPQQAAFVTDVSRFTSALCPRRAGKTYACTVKLLRTALTIPGTNLLYLTLTRVQAAKNMWLPLRNLDEDFELGGKFHGTNLTYTLVNGSIITLSGAQTRQEIDKLRGQSYDLVVIDECKSFNPYVMQELLDEILGPALNDRLGSLALIGTPGNIMAGPFYEATTGEHRGWSFHRWSVQDNVALPHLWDAAVADKLRNGWVDDDPRWLREYVGEWCPSSDVTVYSYNVQRNQYDGTLPSGHSWKYLLGLDLGFEDPVAIVVMAYADTCPHLYHVWDYKAQHLTIDGVAAAVLDAERKFGKFEAMVLDRGTSGGKTMQASLASMYGLHFEPAEKHDKKDYIELLNSDLISGKIHILKGSALETEMMFLQWQDHRKLKEDPQLDNHAADAALYTWRYAHHHFFSIADVEPQPNTAEWYQRREDDAIALIVARRQAARESSFAEWHSGPIDGDPSEWN